MNCYVIASIMKHVVTYHLDEYNAYDDKGNKIEGEYITLMKKEYDNK